MAESLPNGLESKAAARAFAPILSMRLHALYDSTLQEALPAQWRALIGAAIRPSGIEAAEAAADASHEPATASLPPSALRILLVEDDGLIRMTSAALLRTLGHQVFEAVDADEALAVLEDWLIDLLITDVNLPGCSGVELARLALTREPQLRVIFATGMRSNVLGDGVPARSLLLPKPYGERELRRALAQVILL